MNRPDIIAEVRHARDCLTQRDGHGLPSLFAKSDCHDVLTRLLEALGGLDEREAAPTAHDASMATLAPMLDDMRAAEADAARLALAGPSERAAILGKRAAWSE